MKPRVARVRPRRGFIAVATALLLACAGTCFADVEVILDNDEDGTSDRRRWFRLEHDDSFGGDVRVARSGSRNGTKYYTYEMNLPTNGTYEVYLWWVTLEDSANDATVQITHADDVAEFIVNQRQDGGQWNPVGQFSFGETAQVMIIASDNGLVVADAVRLVSVDVNTPPEATITSVFPNPASLGTSVTFDGEATDEDGEIATYLWESSLDGFLSDQEDFSTSSLSEGAHTISFSAQDDNGEWSATVSTDIQIDPEPNVPPTAQIVSVAPNPATSGDSISFQGTGSDPDGDVIAYRWDSDRDGILSTSADFSNSALTVGIHTISLIVQDDNLDWSAEDTVSLEIFPVPNVPPTAQILHVGPNPAEEGHIVNFNATGNDSDGDIVGYLWESDVEGELSTDQEFSTSSLTIATHTISLRVQDNDLEWSSPKIRLLRVLPRSNAEVLMLSPTQNSVAGPFGISLEVEISDPDDEPLDVSFHGRPAGSDEEFTIIAIPDTQIYVDRPQFAHIFTEQTQWIVDNIETENIVFVTHEGDIVDDADDISEWQLADESLSLLDGVIPWSVAPGNHDQDLHLNLPDGVSGTLYNDFFPPSRFESYEWWGDSFPEGTNWCNYQLFSASGIDFVIVHLEFCPTPEEIVWANGVLESHADRRAIVTTHGYIDQFGVRGVNLCDDTEYIWDDLIVPNDNVFLVLCGHMKTEGRRVDLVGDREIHQILANYQREPSGGSGWLRILRFIPAEDRIDISTYSPSLGEFRTGDASEFSISSPLRNFAVVNAASGIPSGSTLSASWPNLLGETSYEWFVSVTESTGAVVKSDVWTFTTERGAPVAAINEVTPNPATEGDEIFFDGGASDPGGVIVNYLWESELGEMLSTEEDFAIATLPVGTHMISFSVQDNEGFWSDVATIDIVVEEFIEPTPPPPIFRRGDANLDVTIDVSDGIFILDFLFLGDASFGCPDAGDTDDSGDLDLSDAISVFEFLFLGNLPPPLPGPFTCGPDPTEDIAELGCDTEPPCE